MGDKPQHAASHSATSDSVVENKAFLSLALRTTYEHNPSYDINYSSRSLKALTDCSVPG
jgi:hypothetical protein